MFQTLTVY